jgi:hypothetical protein
MTAIQPVENQLSELIERDFYRGTLADISSKYEGMQTYINNLAQDIASIDDFLDQLRRDAAQGFDVGSSQSTLLFQRSTLQIDLDFYQQMKRAYLRKIYEDLYGFTDGIVKAAVEIEPNPSGRSAEDLRAGKLSGVEAPAEDRDVSMSEIYGLLNVTERNLFELATDVSSFNTKILDAQEKQKRGFAIGNLLMNLESQKTKLTLEFKGYVMRIRQFLEQNRRFADRCLNRVKMISNEIVTEQELAAQAEDEEASGEASGEAASGEAADPTTDDAAAATADAS